MNNRLVTAEAKAASLVAMHGKDDALKHATQCMYMANDKAYKYWNDVVSIIKSK
jgi:hypothetical protein